MANDLGVDPHALQAGATSSEMIAAELRLPGPWPDVGGYPSGAGVLAMDGAVTVTRTSQASRISEQAGAMSVAALQYDSVDSSAAAGLAELM